MAALVAPLSGQVIAPQPQCVHGAFMRPGAKKPSRQGSHAACCSEACTPCPGTHVQSARALAPTAEVFLCAGQGVHSLLLRSGAKEPWAQGLHGFESSLGACAGPAVRPLPGGQRQWSSSAEPGRASSPGGQGEGSTAPAGQ